MHNTFQLTSLNNIPPRQLVRPDQPFQSHPRRVDRAFAHIQEHIIQPAAERCPEERGHHRNLSTVRINAIKYRMPLVHAVSLTQK